MGIYAKKIGGILGVLIVSLFLGTVVKAEIVYYENFDSQASSTAINTLANWYGEGVITNYKSQSSPNSLMATSSSYNYYVASSSIAEICFDAEVNNDNKENIILFQKENGTNFSTLFGLDITTGGTFNNVRLFYTTGDDTIIKGKSVISKNTWYQVCIRYSSSTGAIQIQWDLEDWVNATAQATGDLSKIDFDPNYSNPASQDDLLIDNFDINRAEIYNNVEIVELPESDVTVNIIYDEDNPLVFRKENICYLDYNYCYLYFYAWPQDIGNTVKLYAESEPLQWIGATTITNYANYDGYIPLRLDLTSMATTSGIVYYGAYLDRGTTGFSTDDKFINHIPITWRTIAEEETNLVNLGISQQCDKFNLFPSNCSNLATTSDWLNIGYSLQCAGQTLLYQFIGVSTSTCLRFYDSLDKFTNSFPFNIISYVASTTKNSGLSATTSATVVIAPLRWYNKSTHQYEDTGVSLLSNNTFEAGMGATLYAFYYLWFERLLWILCFGYIFWRILRVMNPSLSAGFSFGPLPDSRDRYYKHRVEEYKQQKRFYDIQETARNMMRKK